LSFFQCFDAVGWVTGGACEEPLPLTLKRVETIYSVSCGKHWLTKRRERTVMNCHRVAKNIENLEYSGISLNMENSELCATSGENYNKLEMWANAHRDGRPAEHRLRPLFNAAKCG